jgi:hypothetical protein
VFPFAELSLFISLYPALYFSHQHLIFLGWPRVFLAELSQEQHDLD